MLQRTLPEPVLSRAFSAWERLRARIEARRALTQMSARDLRDIGIGAAERQFELGHPPWHDLFAQAGRERRQKQLNLRGSRSVRRLGQ